MKGQYLQMLKLADNPERDGKQIPNKETAPRLVHELESDTHAHPLNILRHGLLRASSNNITSTSMSYSVSLLA